MLLNRVNLAVEIIMNTLFVILINISGSDFFYVSKKKLFYFKK